MALESSYQAGLINRIKFDYFPGSVVLKNDSGYLQGILDLTILYGRYWAMLEVKAKETLPGSSDFEPNQEWYIYTLNQMSFAACIYPENEDEVIRALQQVFKPRRQTRVPVA